MKKLFTLFALLAMVLSASAKVVVDGEIDFTKKSDGPIDFSAWGGGDRLSYQGGYLHYHGEEATPNAWDVQFLPINNLTIEKEVVYTVEFKIKGSAAGPIWNMKLGGVDKYSLCQLAGNDEWETFKFEYTATNEDTYVLFQCGSYVGDWDMEYMKVTHEEEESGNITEWKENLVNGDAEGEFGEIACVQSKIFDADEEKRQEIFPSEIIDEGGNKVFVTHSKAVVPPLVYEEGEKETWEQEGHPAGTLKPANAWQNQMWIVFPRAMKDGEAYTLKFKYKASKAVKVSTQTHNLPGSYLGGGPVGDLNFTTSWQTFEKKCSGTGEQSIAFNLGQEIFDEDIDFYLDDISMQTMVLEEGYFVAGINNGDALAKYDYQNAIKFEYDEDEEAYKAVIGTKGDETSWVNEVMISTVRGDDKQFQVNTIKLEKGKPKNDPEAWVPYVPSSKAKLQLPAAGVWQIMIAEDDSQINFIKLEGESDKEPQTIVPNPTEVIVNATEKGEGNPWDNQFFILGNRTLQVGETVIVEFEYKAEKEAPIGSQSTKGLGEYLGGAWDLFTATPEYQKFTQTKTVEKEGQNSFTFNLSEFADANTYYFKNIVFCNEDRDESLIDMVGTTSLYVKEGAGTAAYEFGHKPEDTGINNVTVKATSNATYNLAGQRVSKEYKGIAIKNGQKFVIK